MTAGSGRRTGPLAWLLILPIRFYQRFISPLTPPSCRYYPVCSTYAIRSLRTHGAIKGLALTAWRLLRCNPWSSGGVDHVPPHGRWRPPSSARDADPGASADRHPRCAASGRVVAGAVQDGTVGKSLDHPACRERSRASDGFVIGPSKRVLPDPARAPIMETTRA